MAEVKVAGKRKAKMGPAQGVLAVVLNAILILFSISCIFPLFWMLNSALDNFINILSNANYHLGQSIWNSARTTILSVFFIVLFGFIVGYILARVKFKGNRLLFGVFLTGMLIPQHSLLVPIYVVFKKFGLSNHWFTLVIPYVAFGLPIAIFLVEGFVKTIPTELEQAAAIDGCGFSKTMFSIIMPICRPIMVTVAIIQSFGCWNEFSFALVLIKNVSLQTVPLALTQFKGRFASDYPKQMAAMLITMSPIVILYFAFSKQIIEGMVAGAVKG